MDACIDSFVDPTSNRNAPSLFFVAAGFLVAVFFTAALAVFLAVVVITFCSEVKLSAIGARIALKNFGR